MQNGKDENSEIDMNLINGQFEELKSINTLLTSRCTTLRGAIAQKDAEISRLTQELFRFQSLVQEKMNAAHPPEQPSEQETAEELPAQVTH